MVAPQKINDLAILLLDIHPKELKAEIQTEIVHPSSLKVEATQASTMGWIDKQSVAYANYYSYNSDLERNGILIHATAWKNLEDILLIEISWTQ